MKNNVIPPMTDPLGEHWKQPKRENILIDDTHAVMTQSDWNLLPKYNTSKPTGVYPGKMWGRDEKDGIPGGVNVYLCWYGEVPNNPNLCSNNYRHVLIIEE
jgi:hypothetical protein